MIYPDPEQTFWSRVIGLGYPTPEPPGFRWCTDRLKIMPMNKFVNDRIKESGEIIIASYASYTSQITPVLNLSDFDRFELTAKINNLLAYDTNRIKAATDDIKASLKCVKRIRKKMERSSIENYDGYLQMKSDLNEQKLTHYLLCVYEADGCGRKEIWTTPGRGNNTVEHVLPQTVKPTTEWGKYWISQFGSVEDCDTYKILNKIYLFQNRRPFAIMRTVEIIIERKNRP